MKKKRMMEKNKEDSKKMHEGDKKRIPNINEANLKKIARELINAEISEEMRAAYLNYAMSVIVARALPSAEDGLKPVHRRILWAMYEMGLQHNKQTKKSGRIVGDTMGKYHPHGDAAIYEAMVRMAQDFSMRYPLVIGQGNFGSIDGDSPAHSRYTEAKMEKIASELLEDIEKNTVEMIENYDNTLKEPTVLPGKIPNLLLNGGSGIAVGMATNIPPHNIQDVCNAIITFLKNPECKDEELFSSIKGPDFPTGGRVSGEIKNIYSEGRGRLTVEGVYHIEEAKKSNEKDKIVITEIPYQINKSSLVEQIASYAREKKFPDIVDLRDESNNKGIRIVIELRKGSNPKFTINRLYKYTNFRTSFNVNMLALVNRVPKLLNLRDYIQVYSNHRRDVIRKSKEYDLEKAKKRLHIVEGLIVAQSNIDEVIRIIKSAKSKSEAQAKLKSKFNLTDQQLEAILDMRLHQLTSLEFERLKKEEADLGRLIEKLQRILKSDKEIVKIIIQELENLIKEYGDDRRTKIVSKVKELEEKDLVHKKDVVVTITDKGYIKRIDVEQYREQKRGGRGVIGSELTEGDFVRDILTCTTHDYLLFFTNKGKVHWLKAYEIPASVKSSKGKAIVNLLDLKEEKIASVIAVKEFKDFLMMATEKGVVKRIELSQFSHPRKGGIKAIKLVETGDTLISVKPLKENQEVLLVTAGGQAIRFNSNEVRQMGRSSYGVTGIKMSKGDRVVSLEVLPMEGSQDYSILTITEKGYGKRSSIEDYRLTSRAGKGVINMKATEKTGEVIASQSVKEKDSVIITTEKGIVMRIPVENIRVMGRATQGVRMIKLSDKDKVSDIVRVPKEERI